MIGIAKREETIVFAGAPIVNAIVALSIRLARHLRSALADAEESLAVREEEEGRIAAELSERKEAQAEQRARQHGAGHRRADHHRQVDAAVARKILADADGHLRTALGGE